MIDATPDHPQTFPTAAVPMLATTPERSLHELYAEYDRLWDAFCATPLEERREWSQKRYSGDTDACRLWRSLAAISEQITPRQRDFEVELRQLSERAADDDFARDLYSSLCNVEWEHEDGSRYSCSWRYAGGLVAELRDCGEDYLEFYCNGNEGTVSDEVAALLEARGWHGRWDDGD